MVAGPMDPTMSVRMVLLAAWLRVEVPSVIPQERASERVQQHAAEKGVPRFRKETVVEERSIPCERVQQQAGRAYGG